MKLSVLKTIQSEQLKLKHSPVWLAFFALPIISAFFGTANYAANQGVLQHEWYSLWSQHTLFLCYLFMPALIGTYCSYLWRLEHMRNNWNSFLTAPVPLYALCFGKLFQAVMMIILGNAWIFLLYFLCGKICGLTGLPPKESIEWFLCGIPGGIVICCIQLTVSMLIRSFAVPIGIGLAGGIGALAFTSKGWGVYFPYSLYSIGMRANNPNLQLDTKLFITNSLFYIILFSVLSIAALHRRGQ
ncbi:MAG: ABC transporter permease subunit [Lachnospiraceae bacterium]|nr:ABC transporter permease subunit [Lachnospiraceae bacterium]MCI9200788.1 ABC transporter permease subunit [Lachnospiraceae bacterium]